MRVCVYVCVCVCLACECLQVTIHLMPFLYTAAPIKMYTQHPIMHYAQFTYKGSIAPHIHTLTVHTHTDCTYSVGYITETSLSPEETRAIPSPNITGVLLC